MNGRQRGGNKINIKILGRRGEGKWLEYWGGRDDLEEHESCLELMGGWGWILIRHPFNYPMETGRKDSMILDVLYKSSKTTIHTHLSII